MFKEKKQLDIRGNKEIWKKNLAGEYQILNGDAVHARSVFILMITYQTLDVHIVRNGDLKDMQKKVSGF